MVSKSSEIKNLNSRDVPTRRKAVRWLIENEIHEALPNFIKFIDDDDVWFREKAKYVFTNWCSDQHLDLVMDLLSNKSRKYDYFISTFLSNFSNNIELLIQKLVDSDNSLVRINVRKFQLINCESNRIKSLILEILDDPDYRVRLTIVNVIHLVNIDEKLIDKVVEDKHSKVKLGVLEKLDYSKHSDLLKKFDNLMDEKIKLNLTLLRLGKLVKNKEFNIINSSFLKSDISTKRKIVAEISQLEWLEIKYFIDYLLNEKQWELLILILNKSSNKDLTSLRFKLSMDDEVPIELRLKLIQKLKSKVNDINLIPLIENLEESTNIRLVQEAEFLRRLVDESFVE